MGIHGRNAGALPSSQREKQEMRSKRFSLKFKIVVGVVKKTSRSVLYKSYTIINGLKHINLRDFTKPTRGKFNMGI